MKVGRSGFTSTSGLLFQTSGRPENEEIDRLNDWFNRGSRGVFPKSLKPSLKLGIVQLSQDRVRSESEALRIVRPVSSGLALNKLMPQWLETGCHERRLDNRPPIQAPFEQVSGFGEERDEGVIVNLFNRARSQTGEGITPQHSAAFSYRRVSVSEMVENHRQEDHTYGFVSQWERFSRSTDERHPATSFPIRFRKHFFRWFYSDDARVQSPRQPSRIATRSAAKVQYDSDRCISERVGDDLQPPSELLRTIATPTIVAGGRIRFVVIHSADCQLTNHKRRTPRKRKV